MNNENPCSKYRTYLANVTKVGAQYTIKSEVSYLTPEISWNGDDGTYPSEVTTRVDCDGIATMNGLGFGWMYEFWGEIIVSGGTLAYTTSGTTITIPMQKYCRTTYNGATQPEYSIKGSGTIDNSDAYPVYTIQYDFYQGGKSVVALVYPKYWPTPYIGPAEKRISSI